jgi:cell division protein FtsB
MAEIVEIVTKLFPSTGSLIIMCLSLVLLGWYGRDGLNRVTALETYAALHTEQYNQGLERLNEMHEAVIELKALNKQDRESIERLDKEIYRLRDGKK